MKKNYIGLLRRKETTGNPKKNGWLLGTLAAAALLLGGSSYAQTNVANYSFAKGTGATYTPITGGTKLFPTGTNTSYDNEVSSAITLSSPFTFGGVAVTSIYVSANGYVTFGAAPSGTTYTPLSTLGTTTGAISAFGQDAGSSTATGAVPEVSYLDSSTEFVIQYQDHANYYNRTTERLNFQIRLMYATGEIKIVYGACTNPGTVDTTSGITPQVGIRGNSTTFATNVSPLTIGNVPAGTTCDWSKAVTGNANSSTMLFSGSSVNVKIPTGLVYIWTPGTQLPVRTFAATTAVTNSGATLSWTAPTGATAYNVQYRALGSCDWTDFSGNPVAATSATLAGLAQNTTYQVQVQALNGNAVSMYSHIPNLAGSGNGYAAAGSFTTVANCASTVTGLASSALTPDTATISWTASTTAPGNGYEYYYSTSSTAPLSTTTPSGSVTAGVITANLSGLTPSTQYYYWIRGNCNGTDKGVWSSSANFTTLGLCPTVTAPAANAVGVSTTPTITWTAINGATGYIVKVGTTSGGTEVGNFNVTGGTSTSYPITTPLNNSTNYYYSVTAYTATTAAPATPCTVRVFQTVCPAITALPWTENFDSMSTVGSGIFPTCWGQTQGSKSWVTSNAAYTSVNDPLSAPNYATIAWSNTTASILWSPAFQLTAGVSYDYSFFFAGDTYTGWTGDVVQNTSQSATGATVIGSTFIASSTTSTSTYAKVKRTFVPTTSGVYYFGVRVISNSTPTYLGVDDFRFETTPTCVEPTAVTASNITTTTADVAWTAPSTVPANGYEIYYSTTSTAPGATTPATTTSTTTSKSLSSLLPSSTYYVWVRSVCSTTDKSAWSMYGSFATACGVVSNLSENFDNTSSSGNILPNCWSKIVTGSANSYVQAGTVMSGPNNLYIYASAATETCIVKLPQISTLSSGNYSIAFKGRANFTAGGVVQIGYMTDASNASTFVVLGTYTASSTTVIDNFVLPIVGVPAGVTTLALKHTGNPAYSVILDDVKYDMTSVLATGETTNVKNNNIKVYPNPFADVLNISDVKNVKSVSVIDIAGRLVKTIEKPSSALQLGELKSGMYIVVLNMNDGSKQTIKAIKK
ncbi:fibronectin type III domain-containing protein [Chryseobacterium sp. PBS4-4]|uniref:Fibronectin type III domain-containing protein n=1 Tax=Chryseobacterium edaphi TaxID=2976532 RepID=A0ABT2W106_9FLAO|nr:fibronectin type III domain-containing protein [Chryseobacterium edaphi]MCU7615922.1 fibronectin type III domain-containing protein [Chryseobacterium edaphi]